MGRQGVDCLRGGGGRPPPSSLNPLLVTSMIVGSLKKSMKDESREKISQTQINNCSHSFGRFEAQNKFSRDSPKI